MPFAEWIPRLDVQVAVIDAQHQQLFARINRLGDAYQAEDETESKAMLAFLMKYVVHHVALEDRKLGTFLLSKGMG